MHASVVQPDFEGKQAGAGQGYVEYQHRSCLQFGHSGRRLAEFHGSLAAKEFLALIIHKTDLDPVGADFGPLSPDPQHQMRPRVGRGEISHPDVLEDSQYGQLALLVDQGIVRQYRKIELQVSSP